jgi:putative membrane-bound dehydrogenase-like protein
VSSYSNDVLCYVPSRRVLSEGGYEAEGAMVYYARPTRFAPAIENDIVRAVHSIVPTSYRSEKSLKEFPLPRSPEESKQCLRVDGDAQVELVATEPLVQSPVAIDWDLRGRLWVLEMYDYPSGLHDNNVPGGRVVILESSKHDGRYDQRRVFLDHLPYPQGLMCWRSGVLVCAAPNVLYAPDDDGDGKADTVRTLFSGFSPDNQQWEVNGLTWGLDNWVYGASSIHNDPINVNGSEKPLELGGRDFRMNPDTLAFEPAAGRTQFCRVRDDWGNWFGNDNSNPLWHYPLEERYVRRNPHVAYPGPRVAVVADVDPTRLYPISPLLERFNNPESANRVTSGCGPTIYRDRGEQWSKNDDPAAEDAFFCEPVHNLVRRLVLTPRGATFAAHRSPADEREFLASSDNWFRPVQVRTGPDGSLWVVDMYRFVIEHPRWITKERLATLDTRAGAEMGRIYRVIPPGGEVRPIEELAKLTSEDLARKIDGPNGVVRDLAHRELVHRQDKATVAVLARIATGSENPAARVQAACALDGLHSLKSQIVNAQIADADPRVRRNAVRLAEPLLATDSALAEAVFKRSEDPDAAVRYQAALTLGELDDPRVPQALARIAQAAPGDAWTRGAVLSAAVRRPMELFDALPDEAAGTAELRARLASLIAATAKDKSTAGGHVLLRIAPADPRRASATQLNAMADVLDSLGDAAVLPEDADARRGAYCAAAPAIATDSSRPLADRIAAMRLMGRIGSDRQVASELLDARQPPGLQSAALAALMRNRSNDATAALLISALPRVSPSLRAQTLDNLVSRAPSAEALLAAVDAGKLSATDLPAATRDRLLKHADATVRRHAQKTLAVSRPPARAAAIQSFQPALSLKGDATHGKGLFEKSCAACHRLGDVGSAVGPDLSALTDKSANYLLVAILDPNAAVEGRFVAYQVETVDGDTYVGLLGDENASALTILQASGMRQSVARSQIKSLSSSKLSLMPEGLEQGMTLQDLADLIAFVQQPR